MFKLKDQTVLIEQFTDIHGSKYDYSLVKYQGVKKKVSIICAEHGVFEQLPSNHLSGNGCPKCAGHKKTLEEVIKSFKERHGEKYNYSRVVYCGNDKKILIGCPMHGDFEQTPSNHRLSGCPKCAGRKTKDDLIEMFKAVHGEKYDYSLVSLGRMRSAVSITCPKHGVFSMSSSRHLSGGQCPSCTKNMKSVHEIISELLILHPNKYDYSLLKTVDQKKQVTVVCGKHGQFSLKLGQHIKGQGCPACNANIDLKKGMLSKTELLAQFNLIHGGKYTYENLNYQGTHVKIDITCPTHGIFQQTPANHKQGNGCPKCAAKTESRIVANAKRFLNTAQVIAQFKLAHPNGRYSYELVEYKGNQVKVDIRCEEHGVFSQTPDHHKKGRGCPSCANQVRKEKMTVKPVRYASVKEHLIATGQLASA